MEIINGTDTIHVHFHVVLTKPHSSPAPCDSGSVPVEALAAHGATRHSSKARTIANPHTVRPQRSSSGPPSRPPTQTRRNRPTSHNGKRVSYSFHQLRGSHLPRPVVSSPVLSPRHQRPMGRKPVAHAWETTRKADVLRASRALLGGASSSASSSSAPCAPPHGSWHPRERTKCQS